MNNRQFFLQHIGQTTSEPLLFEITKARGNYLYDPDGKKYLDLIGGISVCNTGHGNTYVSRAIKKQVDRYTHVMVNGELILSPQLSFAKLLTDHLPPALNAVFYTPSGSEATEGVMKLAKRYTGRFKIAAFKNSYHGSTQGSLSIMGSEYWRNTFRPLLPGMIHLEFNDFESLEQITSEVACVIAETIQGEAGVIVPDVSWMRALRDRCTEVGALLVLDEIQCGFGRTGTLFAFEQFGIVPDILLIAKAMGGGMPLGAFVADKEIMDAFMDNPILGHMNTFGGHPVCCAAGQASMEYLLHKGLMNKVPAREALFRKLLQKIPAVRSVRSKGLIMAVDFADAETCNRVVQNLITLGAFTDSFLYSPQSIRLAPPLTITNRQIREACELIKQASEMATTQKTA